MPPTSVRPTFLYGTAWKEERTDALVELALRAGHFGLVVGSLATDVTWPTVAAWVRSPTPSLPRRLLT